MLVRGLRGEAGTAAGGRSACGPSPQDLDLIEQADTVLVPGWRGPDHSPSPAVLDALARVPERSGRLVSICSGVFALAAAGGFDGRHAATHCRYTATLVRCYPRIEVDPDVLYADDGPVPTLAGSAAYRSPERTP